MGRHQTGYLYKALGGWHVRYWKTELKGGKPIRVQRSEKLCDADDKATKFTVLLQEFLDDRFHSLGVTDRSGSESPPAPRARPHRLMRSLQ